MISNLKEIDGAVEPVAFARRYAAPEMEVLPCSCEDIVTSSCAGLGTGEEEGHVGL